MNSVRCAGATRRFHEAQVEARAGVAREHQLVGRRGLEQLPFGQEGPRLRQRAHAEAQRFDGRERVSARGQRHGDVGHQSDRALWRSRQRTPSRARLGLVGHGQADPLQTDQPQRPTRAGLEDLRIASTPLRRIERLRPRIDGAGRIPGAEEDAAGIGGQVEQHRVGEVGDRCARCVLRAVRTRRLAGDTSRGQFGDARFQVGRVERQALHARRLRLGRHVGVVARGPELEVGVADVDPAEAREGAVLQRPAHRQAELAGEQRPQRLDRAQADHHVVECAVRCHRCAAAYRPFFCLSNLCQ
ncbi:hypothetical protein [Variovorax sp. PDC80]|uniref:hypothetical protein n=1 Tax=Variovorax sp. PDC80 TaxID=1882827 RepID=UPI0035295BFC